MSSAQSRCTQEIVHIRPGPPALGPANPAIRAVEEMLTVTSLRAEVFTDVYRGLARLCSPDVPDAQEAPQPRAVIVCVDDLGPAELEFFLVLGRACPNLPVYVYGMDHFASRIDKAIELGATARATGGVIRSLADIAAPPPGETPEPSVQDETEPETSMGSAALGREDEVEQPASESPPAEEVESEPDHDSREGPARVPWLRYADGPTRGAPKHSAPVPPEAQPVEASDLENEPREASEPLLTDAELQALIGDDIDDIAAIAPEDRPDPEVDGHVEGKGLP
ncbi:MAG: hypothetical protein ACYTFA_13320 [Planctomycetota bacterium]|jgi:hypothetical protein